MNKKHRLEAVTWRDANFSFDGGDPESEDCLLITVGWTSQEGRWVVVRSEINTHTGDYRAVTRIPRENVVKRQRLK